MDSVYTAPPELNRIGRLALIVGVVALLLMIVGFFLDHDQFYRSYLVGYVFWIGITLGCLAILMLQHLTGGAWGLVIRRVLESGTRTLPLMALLFIPLIFGMHSLYEWTHPLEGMEPKIAKILKHKQPYLNTTGFLLRTLAYFVIWGALCFFLNKWSREQDRTAERGLSRNLRRLSAPGIVIFVLTVTFAAIDWVMSINFEWFSTIFGLLFVAGWALSCFAFVIVVMVFLTGRKPLEGIVAPAHFHDLGKLLLAFVMVWAYFNFSQYLIIWSGNIPEETKWFLYRTRGGWGWVGLLLVIFHFALPFVLLLSRDLKRSGRMLAGVAGLVLLMRFVDFLWLVAPEFSKEHFSLSWMYFVAPIALGGLWLWFFAWQLKERPLLPFNDPEMEAAIERGQHGGH